ncbi:hypothetical protein [Haladaptatus pallidirubidus]
MLLTGEHRIANRLQTVVFSGECSLIGHTLRAKETRIRELPS